MNPKNFYVGKNWWKILIKINAKISISQGHSKYFYWLFINFQALMFRDDMKFFAWGFFLNYCIEQTFKWTNLIKINFGNLKKSDIINNDIASFKFFWSKVLNWLLSNCGETNFVIYWLIIWKDGAKLEPLKISLKYCISDFWTWMNP